MDYICLGLCGGFLLTIFLFHVSIVILTDTIAQSGAMSIRNFIFIHIGKGKTALPSEFL